MATDHNTKQYFWAWSENKRRHPEIEVTFQFETPEHSMQDTWILVRADKSYVFFTSISDKANILHTPIDWISNYKHIGPMELPQ